jgi:hypothetical protein
MSEDEAKAPAPAPTEEPNVPDKEVPEVVEVLEPTPEPEKFNKFTTEDQGFDINKDQYDMNAMLDAEHAADIAAAAKYEQEDLENEEALRNSAGIVPLAMQKYLKQQQEALKKKRDQEQKYLDKYFAKPVQQKVKKGDSPPPLTSFVPQSSSESKDSKVTSSDDTFLYYSNMRGRLGKIEEQDEYIHLPRVVYEAPDYEKKPKNGREAEDRFFLWLHPSSFKIKLAIAVIISFIFIGIFTLFGWALIEYLRTPKKNM